MIRRTFDILLVGNGNGVQGLGAGVLSVGRGMVHHFLRMKVCQLVDLILQDHTSSFLINIRVSLMIIKKSIRAVLSRIVGEDSKVQRVSASWLRQLFVFFFESQRRHFSRSSAGKDDLVCLRVGLSSIDSRGTLVAGPPPSAWSSRQCRDISNLPGSQGSLSMVYSNTLMIRKVQKEHVPETESDCKPDQTSAPFLQGFARFRLRSKCTCCLGNSRCSTVDEKSSICHDHPLVCLCFFRH